MSKTVIDIRDGVVILLHHGEKHIFGRHETGRLVLDTDHPEAEQPDTEEWTAFKEYDPRGDARVFMNNLYTVQVRQMEDGVTHLSIRRNDRHWARDWRHFQRIKNELCGPEREGVELYPAESRLIDEANQFHVWVGPEGTRFPTGYPNREVRDEPAGLLDGFKQRPRNGETT